ncbi:hypothetical protein ACWENS_43160 [Streptomyces sp. NPDC004532]
MIIVDAVISFEAASPVRPRRRARARKLVERYPALLIIWDALALPGQDMRGRPGRPHGSGLDGYMSEVWTATGVRPRSRRRKGRRDARPPVRWRRHTADGYGFAAQGPGRSERPGGRRRLVVADQQPFE